MSAKMYHMSKAGVTGQPYRGCFQYPVSPSVKAGSVARGVNSAYERGGDARRLA